MKFDNKLIDRILRVVVFSGQATVEPPLGPLLVQYGINSIQFCKEFNEETSFILESIPLTVYIIVYFNKTYNFSYTSAPASYIISRLSNKLNTIDTKNLYLSTFYKNQNSKIRKNLLRQFLGTCKSMNLMIVN